MKSKKQKGSKRKEKGSEKSGAINLDYRKSNSKVQVDLINILCDK